MFCFLIEENVVFSHQCVYDVGFVSGGRRRSWQSSDLENISSTPRGRNVYPRPRMARSRTSSFRLNKPVAVSSSSFQRNDDIDKTPETIIKGENGVIKVDGNAVQSNDRLFKRGIVNVEIQDGCIRINGNSIYKGKPTENANRFSNTMNSMKVSSFEIRISKNGGIVFRDNLGSFIKGSL